MNTQFTSSLKGDAQLQSSGGTQSVEDLTKRNIALIAQLDNAAQSKRSMLDRIVDGITAFCGRIAFVWVHVIWFGAWIIGNNTKVVHFDPYPFNLLTLVVSLEAIFLSTFILISQNRQSRIAERRSHLDLQINLLSEQENTKMLMMLSAIQTKLGIADNSEDIAALLEEARPETMVDQIEQIIEREVHEKKQDEEHQAQGEHDLKQVEAVAK